nr:hypothetical protein [Tanacetum cinerariifolium]
SSGLRRFFRYAMFIYSCYLCYVLSLYPFTERYAQPYFFSCLIRQFFANETEKIDKYISGLPDNIYGSVKASKPKMLDETIELATDLIDQKLCTYAERQTDNKRKADDSSKNNHGHQQHPSKRQNVTKVYNMGSGKRKPYGGNLPKCTTCHFHHNGSCTQKCHKCNKVGHLARDCRSFGNTNVANTQRDNRAIPKGNGCFKCRAPGHFRRDCPKLKNKNEGSVNAQGWVYAVGNAEKKGNASRDSDSNVITGDQTIKSSHHGSKDELVGNQYVPNWRLHNDLRVCTFRTCKELVSHLATLAEDEFLGALSNVEVISRAYQTLGQSVVAQGELLKRHKQLNHDYVDLRNRNDAHILELDHLRSSVRRTEQENEGLDNKLSLIESAHSRFRSREKELTDVVKDLEKKKDEWRVTALNQVEHIHALEKDLEPKTYQLATTEERIRVLEGEKRALSAELARSEIDRQNLIQEFIPTVVRRLHTSAKYRKVMAVPVSLCYTAGWLGGISLGRYKEEIAGLLAKIKDLDIEDVPTPRPTEEVPGSTGEQADDTNPMLPPPHHEITEDTPFGTTT